MFEETLLNNKRTLHLLKADHERVKFKIASLLEDDGGLKMLDIRSLKQG